MNPVTNPYSPGAGRKPSALVGRDRQRQEWTHAIRRVELGRSAQPVVLYGLRGVGKTVLLSDFRRSALDAGWMVAQGEAGAGLSLRKGLGEALHGPLTDLALPSAGTRLLRALKTALSFKASYDTSGAWNFGLDLSDVGGGGADTGSFETDLRKIIQDVAAAAEEEGAGLAVLIDEAQDLPAEELTALCAIAHRAMQDDWRVLFALAGLPSLPRILAEAKSYSERFKYESVEALDADLARDAIVRPARAEQVGWNADAVELIVAESRGYPYFLQQYGQDTWNAAEEDPITHADARVGAASGRSRWMQASTVLDGTGPPRARRPTSAPWRRTRMTAPAPGRSPRACLGSPPASGRSARTSSPRA